MSFTKNDYKVMGHIYDKKATTEMKSLTVYVISNSTGLSVSKIRSTIKKFLNIGYISEGALKHHSKTYYITEKGISKLMELKGEN